MNRMIYRYSLLALLVGLSACERKLDIDPEQSIPSEQALSTSQNIQSLLIGTYNQAGLDNLYGGFLQMLADLYGFSGEASWVGTFTQPREVYNKRIRVDNSFVSGHWIDAYQAINATNLIIDHLEVVDEAERDRVEGEAKFLRALMYFDLVRTFGAPYVAGQSNNQLGVPLSLVGILDYDGDLAVPRNTVAEGYAQVLADLDDAYNLLPESNEYYADRYSARALAARVYLQQGNYEAARDAANDVIQGSGRVLAPTYGEAFNNDANSVEDLFAFQVTNQSGTNELVVHYASQDLGGRGGDIVVEPAYLDLFDSEMDDRSDFFYESSRGLLSSKYTNQFGNIALIRLAEMYLIRAEGNARLGTAVGATPVDDINALRGRANATLKASVTLDDVLLERQLELAFEGFWIHDIKRTQGTIVIVESVGGEPTEVPIPYNDNRLTYPIPQREIDANPLLEQNPGYGT
ncbi:RagB/SusD family nutrient uptake outer membrane protein [Parapedobacter koreensis]|uniref:SusD family protein n=1 Tax=Parapedobacter koreensis TaxID=332977 RepID=A0A1H7NSI4_9SPHI|nr:RagB/SusD family nutrient uptake outer membrane protein [Parapedobacter koreensis]SEL25955.1 SusD family protein [Parapedobacter koreensis]